MALDQIDISSSGHDAVDIMMNDGSGRMHLTASLPSGTDSNRRRSPPRTWNGTATRT